MSQAVQTACPRCGAGMEEGQATCPMCGAVANPRPVDEFVTEALRLERINPAAAVPVWRQALGLLPPDSPPFQQIQQRIAALSGMESRSGRDPAARGSPAGSSARPTRACSRQDRRIDAAEHRRLLLRPVSQLADRDRVRGTDVDPRDGACLCDAIL